MDNLVKFVITFAFALLFSLLFAWPMMYLINIVFAPTALLAVFGVSHITFWQTYALSIIASFLFKSN